MFAQKLFITLLVLLGWRFSSAPAGHADHRFSGWHVLGPVRRCGCQGHPQFLKAVGVAQLVPILEEARDRLDAAAVGSVIGVFFVGGGPVTMPLRLGFEVHESLQRLQPAAVESKRSAAAQRDQLQRERPISLEERLTTTSLACSALL